MVHMVEAVAMPEPLSAPKNAETTGIAAARPPFTLRSKTSPRSTRRLAIPLLSMIIPARIKSGMASME